VLPGAGIITGKKYTSEVSTMSHHGINSYSKNETVSKNLITNLINQTSITSGDLVYDIGAGAGNITAALLEKGARVIGIEKDKKLYLKCRQRFLNREAVAIHHADFLQWEFSPGHKYKVFANIPFIQTADIVKKLLFSSIPPEDCYLIVQKEAAVKYAGIPKETLVSLLLKPKFWVDIVYYFKRSDFFPVPNVDVVLLQFEKRRCQLVPELYYGIYRDFIVFCREITSGSVKKALKHLFTFPQVKQIASLLDINLGAKPAELNFMQYLCIFQFLLGDNLKNIALIRGVEARLDRQRVKMKKIHRTYKKRITR
jgi:23S rRNA (adenine-N6)-dimethyltransferase